MYDSKYLNMYTPNKFFEVINLGPKLSLPQQIRHGPSKESTLFPFKVANITDTWAHKDSLPLFKPDKPLMLPVTAPTSPNAQI
jgi:hypothetical protein